MRASDIESGLWLCRAAGWNQLESDWLRLLQHDPDGCFVATIDQAVIGTVTTTCYGTQLAWIGMMLVHPDFRRMGVARRLMSHCIAHLQFKQIQCIRLDATPTGAEVYAQLGFQVEWSFQRWSGSGTGVAETATIQRSGCQLDAELLKLDHQAFGVDRQAMLHGLAADSLLLTSHDGYAMLRNGKLASYLGPSVARRADVARRLIHQLCSLTSSTMFWDIPAENPQVSKIAVELGFVPVRQLTRMRLGDACPPPELNLQYALADPSKG